MDNANLGNIEKLIEWLESSGLQIFGIIVAVFILKKIGSVLIGKTIKNVISTNKYATKKDEEQREQTLISIIDTTFTVGIWAIGAILIVQEFGVDTGPLIAGASVLGVALGFGAQSLVKDFVSGLFIILENQYRVGDVVEIAGTSGLVEAITIRTTILRNLDGNVIHVPNGLVDVAKNMTMEYANINLDVGVDYNTDISHAEKVINDLGNKLQKDKDWEDVILEAPQFERVDSFGMNDIVIKILGKVKPGMQWDVTGELRERIKIAFEDNGINIPFPQLVVREPKKTKK